MAKSANNPRTATAATAKTTAATGSKAAAGSVEGAEDEAAKRAAAAEEEARAAKLNDIRGRLADQVHLLSESDKTSAVEAREQWVGIGRLLIEGRNMFAVGNGEPNDVKFGQWVAEQKLLQLMQRPTRAAAIWLAEVYDRNQDLYSLFPTESTNGEPLRRSPRTLKDWVRDQMHTAFNMAWEASSGDLPTVGEVKDKKEREAIARDAMPNVIEVLDEHIDSMTATVEDARKDVAAATNREGRAKTQEAFNSASEKLEHAENLKKILEAHDDDARLNYFMGWKPKQASVPFKETDVTTAAARVFDLLRSHPEFSAVYEALGGLVEAQQAKVDADAAAAATDADAEGFEGEEEDEHADAKAADAAEFDGDDAEAEEFDDEDEDFDADVDAEFEDEDDTTA